MPLRIVAFPFCLLLFTTLANAQENIEFIDVHDILRSRAGISTGIIQTRQCRTLNGCTSYCARKPMCDITRELRNIRVVSVQGIDSEFPDPDQIPVYSQDQELTFENCLSRPWNWSEEVNYNLVRTVSSHITTGFRDVTNRTITLNLNAQFMDAIGITTGGEISATTTVETSTETVNEQQQTLTINKPLEIEIPERTQIVVTYSDIQRSVRIPVSINAVLEADVFLVETIAQQFGKYPPPGTLWHQVNEGALSLKANASNRTVEAEAVIFAAGGERDLTINLREEPLPEGHPACARVFRSESAQLDTLQDDQSVEVRSCSADARLRRASQSSNTLSTVFSVDVDESCARHNGEVGFTAVAEEVDEFGDPLGVFITRQGSSHWSGEEDNDFTLSDRHLGFFNSDEEFVEISDVDLNECTCIISADE